MPGNYQVQGGPALPVKVSTTTPGVGGPALPVYLVQPGDGYVVQGGPAVNTYLVTDPNYPVQGGAAVPISFVAPGANPQAAGGPAIPIHAVNLAALQALMGGGAAAPVTPWYAQEGASPIFAYDANAASYEASKVNLANPGTYDLIDTGHVPDWVSSGWTMANNTKYFDTGYVPPAGSYTAVVEYITFPSNNYFFGSMPNNLTGNFVARTVPGGGLRLFSRTQSNFDSDVMPSPSARFAFSIGTGGKLFVNGSLFGTPNLLSVGANAVSIFLGAANYWDGGPLGTNAKFSKFALYSGVLTNIQMAAITNP